MGLSDQLPDYTITAAFRVLSSPAQHPGLRGRCLSISPVLRQDKSVPMPLVVGPPRGPSRENHVVGKLGLEGQSQVFVDPAQEEAGSHLYS